MTYINHKHQNCHKTIKPYPSNYLWLGGESNKYVKIWKMGVIGKSIFRLFCVIWMFLSWLFKIKGPILPYMVSSNQTSMAHKRICEKTEI